jgi:hypothetical protein
MNLQGSWRRLLGNSISAMVAAIEIYNKPRFSYRDEVFVILLMNSWELLLKAAVSKSGQRVYYDKKRGEPYRSLTCRDAFWRAANSKLWPKDVAVAAVDANLELLSQYRDSAIHFYNDPAFGSVIYSLSQTAILNFRDVASKVFRKDLGEEINWRIMPLGVNNPVDPIQFMKGSASQDRKSSKSVEGFLAALQEKTDALDAAGVPTDRFCTVFDVSLHSIKKIDKADIVVGVVPNDIAATFAIHKKVDPNDSHPYRRKDLLPKLDLPLSTYEFDAVATVHGLREDSKYCWRDKSVSLVKWSPETIRFFNGLSAADVAKARKKYSASQRMSTS